MATQRTGGMTAIGVLNIVFGSLGSLMSLFVVLAGGLFAAGGVASGTHEVATVGTAAGGFVMLIGIGALAINVLLLVSGVGVLKMAPWGRTLSIAYGALGVIIYGASLGFGDVNPFNLCALAYAFVLILLFHRPNWKAAFSPARLAADQDEHVKAAA